MASCCRCRILTFTVVSCVVHLFYSSFVDKLRPNRYLWMQKLGPSHMVSFFKNNHTIAIDELFRPEPQSIHQRRVTKWSPLPSQVKFYISRETLVGITDESLAHCIVGSTRLNRSFYKKFLFLRTHRPQWLFFPMTNSLIQLAVVGVRGLITFFPEEKLFLFSLVPKIHKARFIATWCLGSFGHFFF